MKTENKPTGAALQRALEFFERIEPLIRESEDKNGVSK